jgi:hypothetical protein
MIRNRSLLMAAALLGAASCDKVDPDPGPDPGEGVSIALSYPVSPVRMTGPGSIRLRAELTLPNYTQYNQPDTITIPITTTGPLTAAWEGNPTQFRVVRVTASGPGTGTVTITYAGKTASVDVSAEAVQFKSISLSTGYGCGLALDDTAWCWGGNLDGVLGVGTLGLCSGAACQYGGNDGNPTPLPVDGDRKYVQIATAGNYCVSTFVHGICGRTCALTAAGEAWCWGHGSATAVRMGEDLTLASLAMRRGGDHPLTAPESCGLTTGGKAYCFTSSGSTPLAAGMTFQAFQTGREHSCGISDGDVYCWGSNKHADLGIGSADTEDHPDPVKVPSTARFSAVGVGLRSTCALDTTGVVQCWGYVGSIYSDTTCDAGNPQCAMSPQPVSGGRTYTAMSQGTGQSLICALTSDSQVDCWPDFTKAPETLSFPESITAISASSGEYDATDRSCALSITSSLYCWSSTVVTKFP